MASNNEKLAKEIVKAVLADLTDRSGFDGAWDSADSHIQAEIKSDLAAIVLKILEANA